jgi:plastocyanin
VPPPEDTGGRPLRGGHEKATAGADVTKFVRFFSVQSAHALRIGAATLTVLLLLGATVTCGGASQPAGSTKVTMSDFKFSPSDPSVKAGKVVFYLVNTGTTGHNMVIADSSKKQVAKSELVQAGNASIFTIDNLAAGAYVIFCDQTGHREAGMEGKLQVT